LSGQFLQGSLFAAADAILGAIVPSHTHRNVANQPKYWKIINCGLTILIVYVFPVPLTNSDSLDLALLTKRPLFLQNAFGKPNTPTKRT